MRRLSLAVFVSLLVATAAVSAQGQESGTTRRPRSEKPAADCSRATDATITESVKDRLARAESLKGANINVQTREGVVTLTGTVKTGSLKGVATRVTRRVDCVKKVDNQLSVEQSRSGSKKTSMKREQ